MKRWLKITLAILILLIGTGVVLFDVILERILMNRLESLVQQQKDRVYDYRFDNVELKFISGDVTLTNLELVPRPEIIDSINNSGGHKREIYDIKLKEFRLEGLHSWRFIRKNEIHIEALVFDHPEVKLYSNKEVKRGPSKELAADIIAPTLQMAVIDEFKLINGSFSINNVEHQDTISSISFDSAYISLTDLRMDSSLIRTKEYMTYDEVGFSFKNIAYTSLENYRINIASIFNRFEERTIFLEGVSLSPRLNKYEYMAKQKYETDWFNIQVKELSIQNFDVPFFQKSGELEMLALNINGANLELYRDKRMPDPPPTYKPLPSKILRDLGIKISIEDIGIRDMSIQYLEWEMNATQPIVVKFDNTIADIDNFSTNHEKLKSNDSLHLEISTTFMSKGKMKADFIFPILDTNDLFFAKGEIKDLPLASLNPILHHAAFVKFEEGTLNSLDYEMRADDNSSDGVLNLDYSGLKRLEVVRNKSELDAQKEKKGKTKEKKGFFSFMANALIQQDYNPDSKNYYPGRISFDRVQERAIFGYLVKSIQSGVITSVVPSKQENFHQMKKEKKQKLREEHKQEKRKKKDEKKK